MLGKSSAIVRRRVTLRFQETRDLHVTSRAETYWGSAGEVMLTHVHEGTAARSGDSDIWGTCVPPPTSSLIRVPMRIEGRQVRRRDCLQHGANDANRFGSYGPPSNQVLCVNVQWRFLSISRPPGSTCQWSPNSAAVPIVDRDLADDLEQRPENVRKVLRKLHDERLIEFRNAGDELSSPQGIAHVEDTLLD